MSDYFHQLAEKIPSLLPRCAALRCVLGFDGTVDIICRTVKERSGQGADFLPFDKIRDFGQHITAADGRSALIEIFRQQEKIGGNGPIMAHALATSGLSLDYIGALGRTEIHPAYRDFAQRIRVHSIADPAITHALEFDNGKIMLATLSSYDEIRAETLRDSVGTETMTDLIGQASLCCLLNWTCLSGMGTIFDWLLDEILPTLPVLTPANERTFFFDLADPSSRSKEELKIALDRISRFAVHGRTILGMNFGETLLVCRLLGIDPPAAEARSLQDALRKLREKLGIHMVMSHPPEFAACASVDGEWAVDGPYTAKPLITTGAGDHLNAGFCLGVLLDLAVPEALALGVLFSGYYVRRAHPPTLAELPDFINSL
jgi:sugar/nucleoside kinase (ribokinase family)